MNKKQNLQARRPGGNWDDDDDDDVKISQSTKPTIGTFANPQQPTTSSITKHYESNVVTDEQLIQNQPESVYHQEQPKTNSLEILDIENITTCTYENKLVATLIQPGGVRLKPQKNVLQDFGKSCQTLNCQIISSIFANSLMYNQNENLKIKALYSVEFLIQNYEQYFNFFEKNISVIKELKSHNKTFNEIKQSIIGILEKKNSSNNTNQQVEEVAFDLTNMNFPFMKTQQNDQQNIKNTQKTNQDLLGSQDQSDDLLDIAVNDQQKKQNAFDFISQSQPQQQKQQLNAFDFIQSNTQQQSKQITTNAFDFINQGTTKLQEPTQSKKAQINSFDFIQSSATTQKVEKKVEQKNPLDVFDFIKNENTSKQQEASSNNNLMDLTPDKNNYSKNFSQNLQQQQQQQPAQNNFADMQKQIQVQQMQMAQMQQLMQQQSQLGQQNPQMVAQLQMMQQQIQQQQLFFQNMMNFQQQTQKQGATQTQSGIGEDLKFQPQLNPNQNITMGQSKKQQQQQSSQADKKKGKDDDPFNFDDLMK